eukprot:4497259-Karenia_brevis.AAC.1
MPTSDIHVNLGENVPEIDEDYLPVIETTCAKTNKQTDCDTTGLRNEDLSGASANQKLSAAASGTSVDIMKRDDLDDNGNHGQTPMQDEDGQ